MSYFIQTTIDSADALTQADWWAETLGWRVETPDEDFVRSMVEQGRATEDQTVRHQGRLVWRGAAAISPTDQADVPDRPRMLFQDVPEPKAGKNRVHWDVRTGEDIDEVRARLESRGAAYVASHSQGPFSWHVMTDPEGNEFCVS
ncbi:VOC family protein [Luteipulveratus mongoliensis]|uniref:Glyoxalase-like domain protein n=1 Tax=Luteipulveratus mongoliensis TaxID=571913 RepID=A0A0K1JMM9_9MICO|nr:VOC family protein [Luteipulveratus mongoliensis]AKU17971.1 glyoxalase-like domain protein [Luteipulveratus mongoliensis]